VDQENVQAGPGVQHAAVASAGRVPSSVESKGEKRLKSLLHIYTPKARRAMNTRFWFSTSVDFVIGHRVP
jgi:hypothetical protein